MRKICVNICLGWRVGRGFCRDRTLGETLVSNSLRAGLAQIIDFLWLPSPYEALGLGDST